MFSSQSASSKTGRRCDRGARLCARSRIQQHIVVTVAFVAQHSRRKVKNTSADTGLSIGIWVKATCPSPCKRRDQIMQVQGHWLAQNCGPGQRERCSFRPQLAQNSRPARSPRAGSARRTPLGSRQRLPHCPLIIRDRTPKTPKALVVHHKPLHPSLCNSGHRIGPRAAVISPTPFVPSFETARPTQGPIPPSSAIARSGRA